MFEQPGPDVVAELPRAVGSVLGDPTYADGAQRVEQEIGALPPVAAAAEVLATIGAKPMRAGRRVAR